MYDLYDFQVLKVNQMIRTVLIRRTGSGTGNTILGRKEVVSHATTYSVTTACQM